MSKALRDEIVTYLQGQSYSAPFDGGFSVARTNQLVSLLEETNTVKVFVAPGIQSRERDTRRDMANSWQVLISIQERIDVNTPAAQLAREDEIIELSNEISDHMVDFRSSVGYAVEVFEERPPFFGDDLDQANQMTILLILTFIEYE